MNKAKKMPITYQQMQQRHAERTKKLLQKRLPARWRYVSRTPRKVPKGKIVTHNFVRSTNDNGTFRTPSVAGFRVWTEYADTPNRVKCSCGWAPHLKEHYHVADHFLEQNL